MAFVSPIYSVLFAPSLFSFIKSTKISQEDYADDHARSWK